MSVIWRAIGRCYESIRDLDSSGVRPGELRARVLCEHRVHLIKAMQNYSIPEGLSADLGLHVKNTDVLQFAVNAFVNLLPETGYQTELLKDVVREAVTEYHMQNGQSRRSKH